MPSQVLPFLNHPEVDVRRMACEYFNGLGDASPPETAPALWQAFERFGDAEDPWGSAHYETLTITMKAVGADRIVIDGLIKLLETMGADSEFQVDIEDVLETAPLHLLEERRERILPLVSQALRDHIADPHAVRLDERGGLLAGAFESRR